MPCLTRTIIRRLNAARYKYHICAIKPNLQEHHKQQRVGFPLEYLTRDNFFWMVVIYMDEKNFSTSIQNEFYVYCMKGERFNEKMSQSRRKVEGLT